MLNYFKRQFNKVRESIVFLIVLVIVYMVYIGPTLMSKDSDFAIILNLILVIALIWWGYKPVKLFIEKKENYE